MRQTRREFLRSAAVTAALGKVAVGSPTTSSTSPAEGLPRRMLGRTKEPVTILGLGCAYAGGGVSEAQTRATIETALEGGIRYFDASPEYEQAEVRLGPVVKPMRDKVFLVTKSYALEAKEAEKDLATALRQLQTDHVDLFLQHGVGMKSISTNEQILGKGGSLEFFRKARKSGLTRFTGMSIHAPHATALQLFDKCDDWDVIQPFINYITMAGEKRLTPIDTELQAASDYETLLEKARARKAGIVAMKVLGGAPGMLAEDFDRAFRFALSVPGVTCALIGVSNADHVRRAVQAARRFRPLTDREMGEALDVGEKLVRTRSSKATILERHMQRDLGSPRYT